MNRRIIVMVLAGVIGSSGVALGQEAKPSRTINLVYDDSGSMIRQGSTYVDTWCQAKYALEVVASMVDDRDVLNVYYMSDYDSGMAAPPRIRLHGSQNPQVVAGNVSTVHQMVTPFGNTPFSAVRKAHQDLKRASSDERWLVVLTDGEFEDGKMTNDAVESYFQEVVAGGQAKVMMLAMGPMAATIRSDEQKGIYFEHATSTRDILPKLTAICNRIFQRNALPVQHENAKVGIEFSVPMRELIVLAQGSEVTMAGPIVAAEGENAPSSVVQVKYSEVSSTQNPPNAVVARDLNGIVATYFGPFAPGKYTIEIAKADTVDVYYKPNVSIAAYLYDLDGNEVTDNADIVNGKYVLRFGFVDAKTKAKVEDTSLLGRIDYESVVTNTPIDGAVSTVEAKDNSTIEIREGKLDIAVKAQYLEYNTVKTSLTFDVFFRNELEYRVEEVPEYKLTDDGYVNFDKPVRLSVQMKDGDKAIDLTPEQWAAMGLPKVYTKSGEGKFQIAKGEKIGEFLVNLDFDGVDPFEVKETEASFSVSGGFEKGKSSAAGRVEATVSITNEISDWARFLRWMELNWKTALMWLIAGIILWGYMPWVKKRFGKIGSRMPVTKKTVFSTKNDDGIAKFSKDTMSVIMPYRAETGVLDLFQAFPKVSPLTLKLKAAGNGNIYIMNYRDVDARCEFASKKPRDHKPKKPFTFRPNCTITFRTENDKGEKETYSFSMMSTSKSKK